MSSVNTTVEFVNLPAQVIATTVETVLAVPAQGLYAGLPSPTLAAGVGLSLGFPADIVGSVYDGHAFKVRVVGKVITGASLTFLPKIRQVPQSFILAGTQGVVANSTAVLALAATTVAATTNNFILEAVFLWDSSSKTLNGFTDAALINGVTIAPNGGTAGTSVATTSVVNVAITDLNFVFSVAFGTANATNSFTVTEFSIDRV